MKQSILKKVGASPIDIQLLKHGQMSLKGILFNAFLYYLGFNFLNNTILGISYFSEVMICMYLAFLLTIKYMYFRKLLHKYKLEVYCDELGGFNLKNEALKSENNSQKNMQ